DREARRAARVDSVGERNRCAGSGAVPQSTVGFAVRAGPRAGATRARLGSALAARPLQEAEDLETRAKYCPVERLTWIGLATGRHIAMTDDAVSSECRIRCEQRLDQCSE